MNIYPSFYKNLTGYEFKIVHMQFLWATNIPKEMKRFFSNNTAQTMIKANGPKNIATISVSRCSTPKQIISKHMLRNYSNENSLYQKLRTKRLNVIIAVKF